jgi:enoyl-CoA hydratase/carnithine racemase
VIAAIHGPAVGVGITYPLLCDMRFVAEDARISFIFPKRGLIGELGSHFLLPRIVGFSAASDLLMSGRMINGIEAVELGLAHKAVPQEQLLELAMTRAKEFASTAPASVAMTKRLLWEGLGSTYEKTRNKESRLFAWAGSPMFTTPLEEPADPHGQARLGVTRRGLPRPDRARLGTAGMARRGATWRG